MVIFIMLMTFVGQAYEYSAARSCSGSLGINHETSPHHMMNITGPVQENSSFNDCKYDKILCDCPTMASTKVFIEQPTQNFHQIASTFTNHVSTSSDKIQMPPTYKFRPPKICGS